MKSKFPLKRKNLKLDINHEINYTLIGISSHENDYRLVWAINNGLKINYIRTDNLLVHYPKLKIDAAFSKFTYVDEERFLTYYLISNRCPDGILFPEIKNIDFLMQVVGELDKKSIEALLKSLRKIEIISAAYIIKPGLIKHIHRISPF